MNYLALLWSSPALIYVWVWIRVWIRVGVISIGVVQVVGVIRVVVHVNVDVRWWWFLLFVPLLGFLHFSSLRLSFLHFPHHYTDNNRQHHNNSNNNTDQSSNSQRAAKIIAIIFNTFKNRPSRLITSIKRWTITSTGLILTLNIPQILNLTLS